MNTCDLDAINGHALNTFVSKDQSIGELLALPAYYGFVDTPHDFVMFLGGNDDGIALRYFYDQPFEEMTIPIWKSLVQDAKLILDVGAHTGTYSLLSALNSKADVYAFEPFLPNFSRLLLNLRANHVNRVLAIPRAASSTEGTFDFSINSSMWYLSSGGHLGNDGKHRIAVSTCKIDSYTKDKHVDLIKIDTEGHEPFVIQGAMQTIAASKPTLMLEWNNYTSGIEDIKQTEDFLHNQGYKFYAVDDKEKKLFAVDTFRDRGSEFERNFFAAAREDHVAILSMYL